MPLPTPTPAPHGTTELLRRRRSSFGGLAAAPPVPVHAVASMLRPPTGDPAAALHLVLPSYVHMTNNRLGLSVPEETYTARLLGAALADLDA